MGLLVGGVASTRLAEAIAQLQETKQENRELRCMVDTLVASQTSMMAQNERLEKQYEELKSMLLSSQGHAPITRSPVPKSATKHQLEVISFLSLLHHSLSQEVMVCNASYNFCLKELDDVNYNNHAPSLSSRNKKTLPRSEVCNKFSI